MYYNKIKCHLIKSFISFHASLLFLTHVNLTKRDWRKNTKQSTTHSIKRYHYVACELIYRTISRQLSYRRRTTMEIYRQPAGWIIKSMVLVATRIACDLKWKAKFLFSLWLYLLWHSVIYQPSFLLVIIITNM